MPGYEFPLLLGAAAVALAFSGPGRCSLDAVLGLDRRRQRIVGGVVGGLGAVLLGVAGVLIVMFGFRT
jgi:hypothetical protein